MSEFCNFVADETYQDDHGRRLLRCKRCGGKALSRSGSPRRQCKAESGSLAAQASRWSKAIARWIESGQPERSKEEVDRIYTEICQPCDHFNADKKKCRLCGCRVNVGTRAAFNKIKMATEHCPKEKW